MNKNEHQDGSSASGETPSEAGESETRRGFLANTGTAAMLAGLAASYGTAGYFALRFLMPDSDDPNLGWQFVATKDAMEGLASFEFTASSGIKIVIASAGDATETGLLALSSVCPHLGCQVFWEAANDRFFCPCHNGVFDATGKATAGPPADAKQSLMQYPIKVEDGLVFVLAPLETVTRSSGGGI